jgi:hypothetical protein
LGNDSSLALSTGFVGIGNIPSNAFAGYKLQIGSISDPQTFLSIGNSSSGVGPLNGIVIGCDSTGADIYQRENQPLRLHTNGVERLRILAGGGLTFNGDTAAANALDDYEEGTWTMTATPQSSGTITLGTNGGTYTKIGRQVTCTGRAIVSAVSSPVGSYVQFGGLPFTSLNLVAAQSAPSVYFADASASYASSSIASYLPNNLTVFYAFKDASTVAANDEFAFTITYFV